MTVRRFVCLVALLCALGCCETAWAQKTATVTIPAGVSFSVSDVSRSVVTSPLRVSFTTSGLAKSDKFYISVKADAATFAGPGTTSIPVSKVSWTASPVGGGIGSGGTLSSAAYAGTEPAEFTVGAVDDGHSSTLPPTCDQYAITVRWRLEAF